MNHCKPTQREGLRGSANIREITIGKRKGKGKETGKGKGKGKGNLI